MEYKKKCLWCGKYYVAHTVESRYCSKKCVNMAWKARTRKKEINQKLELRQEVDYHNATSDLKCAEFLTLYHRGITLARLVCIEALLMLIRVQK